MKWTEEENKILLDNYETMSRQELAKILPNRDVESIRSRLINLGLYCRNQWSELKTQFVIDNFRKMSIEEISEKLNFDYDVTCKFISSVIKKHQIAILNENEKQFIIDNVDKIRFDQFAKMLMIPYRMFISLVKSLGLSRKNHKFSKKEIDFIKANRNSMTVQELADSLGRPHHSIRTKLSSMQLKITNRWREEDISLVCNAKTIDECIDLCNRYNVKFDFIQKIRRKNGIKQFRQYNIWTSIKQRCYIKSCREYNNYGGRGISMCQEWRKDFIVFYIWAKDNGYSDELQIDRINNDGDYCPENCRWVDIKTNNRNKRTNHFITAWGERKTLIEWSEDPRCVISYMGLFSRFTKTKNTDAKPEDIISTPKGKFNAKNNYV